MFELLAESGYDHAVPPGHFAGSSHTATCPRHRAKHTSDRILHLRGGDSSGMRSRSSYLVTIVHHPGVSFDLRWPYRAIKKDSGEP